MNIYQAIMKAADHIERNPHEFKFMSIRIPTAAHCGTPGCALGWIAAFAQGARMSDDRNFGVFGSVLGIAEGAFYKRMGDLLPNWKDNAAKCAKALRLYAAKYHVPDPVKAPDWNALATGPRVPDTAPATALII